MSTVYSKDRDGHRIKTTRELGDKRVLIITTSKNSISKRLQTLASVHQHNGTGLTHVIGYGTGRGDFCYRLFNEQIRVTEKAVRDQHQRALDRMDELLQAVEAHYAAQQKSPEEVAHV